MLMFVECLFVSANRKQGQLGLTSFLPDVLDPAAHNVSSGLSQSLTGTNAGPLLPAATWDREGGEDRRRGWAPFCIFFTPRTFGLSSRLLQTYLCVFFFFIMFADTPECPETQTGGISQCLSGTWRVQGRSDTRGGGVRSKTRTILDKDCVHTKCSAAWKLYRG